LQRACNEISKGGNPFAKQKVRRGAGTGKRRKKFLREGRCRGCWGKIGREQRGSKGEKDRRKSDSAINPKQKSQNR